MAERVEVETVVPTGYEVQYEGWRLAPAVRVGDTLYLAEPYPAQTAVGVAELGIPGAVIELKGTAVRGAGSRRA